MNETFYKFPTTPHLATLGDEIIRNDKVFSNSEREAFLRNELVVEEKVDGANLGISFDKSGNVKTQNRGSYLTEPYSGQWKKLSSWMDPILNKLFEELGEKYILFGEWCYAQHTIAYNRLPDWFLGFDLFDKTNSKFLSCQKRDKVFSRIGISKVPIIEKGHFSLPELYKIISQSQLSDKPAEGIYLRFDKGDWLEGRAKLVRPAFIQSDDEHWSRKAIKTNRLSSQIMRQ